MEVGAPVRVSVCIPTYNGARFMAEAMQSVLQQNFSDFELLIVDDCSDDATLDIVRSFTDHRLRIHRNAHRLGIPENWNRCLHLARGEYVCLFHQDDVMLSENLARKVQTLASDPTISFVHSAAEVLVDDSAPTPLGGWIETATDDFVVDGDQYFRKLLLQGDCICAPAVMTRRHHLLSFGGFASGLGYACDYEMWMKLCVGARVAFLAQPLIRYRWHGQNASHAYQFERGAEEVAMAARQALSYYRSQTGRYQEVAVLEEATQALNTVKLWLAHAEKGREGWEKGCHDMEKVADTLRSDIVALQTHTSWLEGRKKELERELHVIHTEGELYRQALETLQSWVSRIETLPLVRVLNKLRLLPLPPVVGAKDRTRESQREEQKE